METEVSQSKPRRGQIARRLAEICDQEDQHKEALRKLQSEREEVERLLLAGEGESFSFIDFPAEGTHLHRLLEIFRSQPDREWRMQELTERSGLKCPNRTQRATFRAKIYDLLRRGLVIKSGRGLYLLKKDPLAATWSTAEKSKD